MLCSHRWDRLLARQPLHHLKLANIVHPAHFQGSRTFFIVLVCLNSRNDLSGAPNTSRSTDKFRFGFSPNAARPAPGILTVDGVTVHHEQTVHIEEPFRLHDLARVCCEIAAPLVPYLADLTIDFAANRAPTSARLFGRKGLVRWLQSLRVRASWRGRGQL